MDTSNSIHFRQRDKKRGIKLTIDFLSSLPCVKSVSWNQDTDEISWEYRWSKFRLVVETVKNRFKKEPTPCSLDLPDLLQHYLLEHRVDSLVETWE
jgi:hypothetical protein